MQELDEEGKLKLRSIMNRWNAMTLELDVAEKELRELFLSQKVDIVSSVELNPDGYLVIKQKTVSVGDCGPGGGVVSNGSAEAVVNGSNVCPDSMVEYGRKLLGSLGESGQINPPTFDAKGKDINVTVSIGTSKLIEYLNKNYVVQEPPKLSELPQARHICDEMAMKPESDVRYEWQVPDVFGNIIEVVEVPAANLAFSLHTARFPNGVYRITMWDGCPSHLRGCDNMIVDAKFIKKRFV